MKWTLADALRAVGLGLGATAIVLAILAGVKCFIEAL